jgi:hypothetical protein
MKDKSRFNYLGYDNNVEDFTSYREVKPGNPIVIDARTGGLGVTTLDRWNKSQAKKEKSFDKGDLIAGIAMGIATGFFLSAVLMFIVG